MVDDGGGDSDREGNSGCVCDGDELDVFECDELWRPYPICLSGIGGEETGSAVD